MEIVSQRLAYRGVRIRKHSESWFGRLLARIAYWLFKADYPSPTDQYGWVICQTIGSTIWVPVNWDVFDPALKFELLLHEEAHTFQFERCGLGSMTFGILIMGFAYICLLPTVWTLRSRFEREAYYQSMRARFLMGLGVSEGFFRHMVKVFTGPGYVWMWPFPKKVDKWFLRKAIQANKEATIP